MSDDTRTIDQRLSEPFADEVLRTLPNKNDLVYVPGSEVIARLNDVCGVLGWEWTITERWESGERTVGDSTYPQWVMIRGRLDIVGEDGVTRSRGGTGGQAVKFKSDGGGPVDLGDEWKGADTDALKKAAQRFGVGLHLARKDEAIEAARLAALAPAPEEVRARVKAALDTVEPEQTRKRLKNEYGRSFGYPKDLTEQDLDAARAWVLTATGVDITGAATAPVQPPAASEPEPAPTAADDAPGEPTATEPPAEEEPVPAPQALVQAIQAQVEKLTPAGSAAWEVWVRRNLGEQVEWTVANADAAAEYLGIGKTDD